MADRPIDSLRALLVYIDEEQVYDKLGDSGCGGVDPYRSEDFDRLIQNARKALETLEKGGG